MKVPLMDIGRQIAPLRSQIDAVLQECIDATQFIQGARVESFEKAFRESCGARHAIGCGSGTDALYLALKALGVGPGDEVIVPAMTFAATPEAVDMLGARPVIVDVEAEYSLLSREACEAAISDRTQAVIFVNLYGQSQGLDRMRQLTKSRGLALVADAAQAHGSRVAGSGLDDFADVVCYSFYPGKNLGAFGDAGACTTHDDKLARDMDMRRNHGRQDKYRHEFSGVNMRMDELQAAVLEIKLRALPAWTARRQAVAARYHAALGGISGLSLPVAAPDESVWHLYVVECDARDALQAHLRGRGVGSGVHYPIPMNRQPAFEALAKDGPACPVADNKAARILSLPMFESMTDEECDYVIGAVQEFFDAGAAS